MTEFVVIDHSLCLDIIFFMSLLHPIEHVTNLQKAEASQKTMAIALQKNWSNTSWAWFPFKQCRQWDRPKQEPVDVFVKKLSESHTVWERKRERTMKGQGNQDYRFKIPKLVSFCVAIALHTGLSSAVRIWAKTLVYCVLQDQERGTHERTLGQRLLRLALHCLARGHFINLCHGRNISDPFEVSL